MRIAFLAAALVLPVAIKAAPRPSHQALVLEAGVSAPLRGKPTAAPLLALSASFWLEGPFEAVATVSLADPGARGGRRSGEGGVRAAVGDRLRVTAEGVAGWWEDGRGRAGATAGGGLGLAWLEGPLTLGARISLRGGAGGPRLLVLLGAGGYF
jgi:hypothetical protein